MSYRIEFTGGGPFDGRVLHASSPGTSFLGPVHVKPDGSRTKCLYRYNKPDEQTKTITATYAGEWPA